MASQTADLQPLLLPVPAVQQLLTCSRSTLRKLEQDGTLVPVRLGKAVRYVQSEVEAHIQRLIQARDGGGRLGRPRSNDR